MYCFYAQNKYDFCGLRFRNGCYKKMRSEMDFFEKTVLINLQCIILKSCLTNKRRMIATKFGISDAVEKYNKHTKQQQRNCNMQKTVTINNAIQEVTNDRLWESGMDGHVFMMTNDMIPELLQLEEICFNPTLYDSLLTKKSIERLIGSGNGFIIVYKQNNKIAGYAQITFRRNLADGRFYSLAVHPDFQGKGIANILFSSVEKICKALDATNVLLEIREDNDTLKSRYEKLGYKQYRLVKNYYPDGCAAIKMKRDVS